MNIEEEGQPLEPQLPIESKLPVENELSVGTQLPVGAELPVESQLPVVGAKKSRIYLILGVAIWALLCVFVLPNLVRKLNTPTLAYGSDVEPSNQERLSKLTKKLELDIMRSNQKIRSKTPKSYFMIINTSANEFTLRKNQEVIKTDKCSTGSYILLKNGDQQEWMFKTPKGEFNIRGKAKSPIWKKPDWAFVEEGLAVPSADHHSRFERGVLGDYALSLGQGYLIHGTLYQRFLGLPVTHGCVRLDDENLEIVYKSLSLGSKVYIY